MDTHNLYDLFGREIRVGDFILRSYSLGSSTTVGVSKVLKVDHKGLRVANVRLEVDLYLPQQQAKRINDGTIQWAKRTVKVDKETLPEEILALFDDAGE